jgi:hypothetical protein
MKLPELVLACASNNPALTKEIVDEPDGAALFAGEFQNTVKLANYEG